ncbi:MAG TPA: aldehyde dehydrogenase (NADP(+)), partial [Edaphobacter sp.]
MSTVEISLSGVSLIGSGAASKGETKFYGVNPTSKAEMEPAFYSAAAADIEAAVRLASEAFFAFSGTTGKARGAFLRKVAAGLTAQGAAIVERA